MGGPSRAGAPRAIGDSKLPFGLQHKLNFDIIKTDATVASLNLPMQAGRQFCNQPFSCSVAFTFSYCIYFYNSAIFNKKMS